MKKLMSYLFAAFMIVCVCQTATINASPHAQLSDEQKTEMAKEYEAKYKEAQEKFNALTDAQKKELYDLYDKINVTKLKLLDKYVEFGLVTKEEADIIRTQMGARAQEIRDGKQFIGFGGMHLHKAKKVEDASAKQEIPSETEVPSETEEEKTNE